MPYIKGIGAAFRSERRSVKYQALEDLHAARPAIFSQGAKVWLA